MNEEIKINIIEYAKSIGIDKIGFTSALPFYELEEVLQQHHLNGYESGFEEKDINKRINPKLILENAESVISIAIAYPSKIENTPISKKGEYRGFVARSAWGLDYHDVLKEKLKAIGMYIKSLIPQTEYICMTDTGTLSDHAIAERAGIGWIGKNSLLITPEYGSYVYLGELITNIKFPEDKPIQNQCGECTKCIDYCPNGAIVKPVQVNSNKCISYLTQSKDLQVGEQYELLGNRLYGCDTCQQVCPKNKGINYTHQYEFIPNSELAKPLLKPLLSISNKEFKNSWGRTAAAWRGKKIIQRNAIIALANLKDNESINIFKDLLNKDDRVMIRQTVAWALGKVGSKEAKKVLYRAKIKEKEFKVSEEIDNSLRLILEREKMN